jgi:hypothetical protein
MDANIDTEEGLSELTDAIMDVVDEGGDKLETLAAGFVGARNLPTPTRPGKRARGGGD